MKQTLRIVIQTPDTVHFDEQADWIRVQTEGGEWEIHPKHVNAMGSFVFSPVIVQKSDERITYYLRQGVVRMDNEENIVHVLAFSCEKESDITQTSIKEYMNFVLEKLESGEDMTTIQTTYLQEQQASLEKLLQVVQHDISKKA